jgi:hypothetical protein
LGGPGLAHPTQNATVARRGSANAGPALVLPGLTLDLIIAFKAKAFRQFRVCQKPQEWAIPGGQLRWSSWLNSPHKVRSKKKAGNNEIV